MRTKPELWLVSSAVSIALIPSLPYEYYSVMRWVVCAACASLALSSYRKDQERWGWIWGLFAGIYNPIFRMHSSREIWSVVNIITISAAVWYGLNGYRIDGGKKNGGEA